MYFTSRADVRVAEWEVNIRDKVLDRMTAAKRNDGELVRFVDGDEASRFCCVETENSWLVLETCAMPRLRLTITVRTKRCLV